MENPRPPAGRVRAVAVVSDSGKAREPQFFPVAKTSEVDPGRGRVVYLRGSEIALFNINGFFYAVDNLCPHEGGPLVAGSVSGMVLTCPWHRWQFHLKTGRSPLNPSVKVQTYPVKIEGEQIHIGLITE